MFLGFYGLILSLPMMCFRFLWCHIKFAYDVFLGFYGVFLGFYGFIKFAYDVFLGFYGGF